jgi:hypothetical protein
MTESTTLQILGLNELELVEIKQELLSQGINPEKISEMQRPAIGRTKLGEPATVILLIEIGKTVAPVIAGALAAWLLKGRKGKKKKQFTFSLSKGTIQLGIVTSDEFVEKEAKGPIQEKVLGFLTK